MSVVFVLCSWRPLHRLICSLWHWGAAANKAAKHQTLKPPCSWAKFVHSALWKEPNWTVRQQATNLCSPQMNRLSLECESPPKCLFVHLPPLPISDPRHSLSCLSPSMLRASGVDLSVLVCAAQAAEALHLFINLHQSQTLVALTSLRIVTSIINTIWARDLSTHSLAIVPPRFPTAPDRSSSRSAENRAPQIWSDLIFSSVAPRDLRPKAEPAGAVWIESANSRVGSLFLN